MSSTSTRTDLTDHWINARPRATLSNDPQRPSGRYDETDSAASSTNTCRSHRVTESRHPQACDINDRLRKIRNWKPSELFIEIVESNARQAGSAEGFA